MALARQPFALAACLADDAACLAMRLGDDHLGLLPRLIAELLGGALGRDQRRSEQALELPEAIDLGLELLDLVAEVGTLTPDLLETLDDVVEEVVHGRAFIAEQTAAELSMSDFGRRKGHLTVL